MIQNVKKAVFEKSQLPSLIVPDAINKNPIGLASFEDTTEQSTLYNGEIDLLKFNPASAHNLVAGDIIELRGLYRVTRADGVIVGVTGEYDIPNIVVHKVDPQVTGQVPSFYIKNDLDVTSFTSASIKSDKLALAEEVEDEYPQYFIDNPSAIIESKFAKINSNYVLRYRIVSEDRNRTSHWSPIYQVSPVATSIKTVDSNIEFMNIDGNTLNIGWTADDLDVKQYFDVYVGYGQGSLTGEIGVSSVSFTTTSEVTTSVPHNLISTITEKDTVLFSKTGLSSLEAIVRGIGGTNTFTVFEDVTAYSEGTIEISPLSGEPNIYLGPNQGVSPMSYVLTTSGNSASFKIPANSTRVKVIVQTQTIPRKLVSSNRVAESSIRSVPILKRLDS